MVTKEVIPVSDSWPVDSILPFPTDFSLVLLFNGFKNATVYFVILSTHPCESVKPCSLISQFLGNYCNTSNFYVLDWYSPKILGFMVYLSKVSSYLTGTLINLNLMMDSYMVLLHRFHCSRGWQPR